MTVHLGFSLCIRACYLPLSLSNLLLFYLLCGYAFACTLRILASGVQHLFSAFTESAFKATAVGCALFCTANMLALSLYRRRAVAGAFMHAPRARASCRLSILLFGRVSHCFRVSWKDM